MKIIRSLYTQRQRDFPLQISMFMKTKPASTFWQPNLLLSLPRAFVVQKHFMKPTNKSQWCHFRYRKLQLGALENWVPYMQDKDCLIGHESHCYHFLLRISKQTTWLLFSHLNNEHNISSPFIKFEWVLNYYNVTSYGPDRWASQNRNFWGVAYRIRNMDFVMHVKDTRETPEDLEDTWRTLYGTELNPQQLWHWPCCRK